MLTRPTPLTLPEKPIVLSDELGTKTRPNTEAEIEGFLKKLRGQGVGPPDSTCTLPRNAAS
jgi:hypothetical protein